MKPLDKKQIPQVVALAVLAVAFFAYFAVKMILPSPAAAGTQVVAPVAKPQARAVPVAVDAVPGTFTAPAPAPGMHDPFVQGVSDQIAPPTPAAAPKPAPVARTASLKDVGIAPLAIPSVPPLPSVGIREEKSPLFAGVPPLPVAPVVPEWTVTGVLQSGAEHVAILRSGDARRFVRQGDTVDGQFFVAAVTRDHVVLRHGRSRFMLPLGGSKTAPTGPAKAPTVPGVLPELPQRQGPTEVAPDTALDTAEGRPVARRTPSVPRTRGAKFSFPSIARFPGFSDGLSAPAPRPLFAFPGRPRPILARLPLAARRRPVRPVVRVADYQSERLSSLVPDAGTGGLLPTGLEAPDFSLSTLGGETLSLSQFRGNVVVVNFWASWYVPSVRSLSMLALLQKKLGTQGLTVLAVNSWDNKAAMQAALQGGEGSTMQLYDPGASNDSVAVKLYHAPDVPTFYVIDREGRVAGAFVGSSERTASNVQATLAKLGILL